MPTFEAIARRRKLASDRVTAAKETIANKLGVSLESPKIKVKDKEMKQVVRLEQTADHFEAIANALTAGDAPETAPAPKSGNKKKSVKTEMETK